MNILFRTDSSYEIGAGHIMRDLVLATQFDNDNIIFATQELEGNINHIIKEKKYKIIKLNSNNVNEIIAIVKKRNIDMVIIDHYQINHIYEQTLKEATGVKIMSLDDTYEKHHCDILLNHNISANIARYKDLVPKKCEIRCGEDFTLLRDEFIQEKKRKKMNIFIGMGGVDHSNINMQILEILSTFKNIKAHIVLINSNKNLKKLQEYSSTNLWVKIHINSNNIAKLMRKCDFAIITPSVIAHEVRYMGLPFISIKTADNQEDIHRYLKEKKFLCLKKFEKNKLEIAISKMIKDIKEIGKNI